MDAYADGASKQPVKDLVRKEIVPRLRKELAQLGPAIIAEHGKDLQHVSGSGSSSGAATPAGAPPSVSNPSDGKQAPSTAKAGTSSGKVSLVNVTTVTNNEEFQTTAMELYRTFTDPQRIAAFTRSPPTLFEGAHKGGGSRSSAATSQAILWSWSSRRRSCSDGD